VDVYGEQGTPEPVAYERPRLPRGERAEDGRGLCLRPRCGYREPGRPADLFVVLHSSGFCHPCCVKVCFPTECSDCADLWVSLDGEMDFDED
jgi:hypothetical protein